MNKHYIRKLDEDCKTHADTILYASWPWPMTFDPKINGFPGLTVDHIYVKFNDPNCIGFEISCGKTDKQTKINAAEHPTHATVVGVGEKTKM